MAAPTTLPVLPPEILQEIVDFHAQLDGDPEDWPHVACPWSSSMLALLSASRQLRLSAIRHIFRDVHVYCGFRERPMDKLRQLIVPDTAGLPLGSIGPNIKTLYIHTYVNPNNYTSSETSADEDEPAELFHIPLLDSIRKQSPLCTLSLAASMVYELPCPWNALPLEFRWTLISFFQLPLLKSFKSSGICGMKGALFKDASFQQLSVADSVAKYGLFAHPAANKPSFQNRHIISLLIHQSDIPESLSLPTLQHLSVARLPLAHLNALWLIITSTWRNLIRLGIDDNFDGIGDRRTYTIPESINISLLPRLEIFKYWHVQKLSNSSPQPTILPPIVFLQVTNCVSALKHLHINVYSEKGADTKEEMISRVATDPSWDTLDHILTKSCFPNLAKVKITLQQSLAVWVNTQDWKEASRDLDAARALHVEVESALRLSFSRLIQRASVSVELHCIVHPFKASRAY